VPILTKTIKNERVALTREKLTIGPRGQVC
jgi:hypothetical protein